MNSLIMHCGGKHTSLAEVLAVPVPEHTDTWKPVAYGDAIELLKTLATERIGCPIKSEAYGLGHEGMQMFGRITLDTGDTAQGLSIGIRQAYNKSLALGTAVGANVFVCDNLAFSGDAFKVLRRNTRNVWEDFQRLIIDQIGSALSSYDVLKTEIARMQATPCHEQRGYALLGVAMGRDILTPTQASVAFGDWAKPRHEEFADRNVWSLYNCVTEGLKKGSPGTLLDRHAKAHDYFAQVN
jgi:hypothetical protein